MTSRSRDRLLDSLLWIAPMAITVALYWPVLHVWFVGDDLSPVVIEAQERPWSQLFTPRVGATHYAPGLIAYWKVVYVFFGTDAVGWHVANLLLQALATMLHYALFRSLGLGQKVAFVGTVLFATLFLGYEVVVCANMALNLLSVSLYLAALLLYRRYQRSERALTYLGFLALALAAALTYEAAIMVVFVLPLLEIYTAGWRVALERWRRYVPIAIVIFLTFAPGFFRTHETHAVTPGPVVAVKNLLTALPYMGLFNQPSLVLLYFSHYGLRVVFTFVFGLVAILCLRRGGALALLVAWAIIHQGPYVFAAFTGLLTAHHPRYFLFSAFGYLGLWAVATCAVAAWIEKRLGRTGARVVFIALLAALTIPAARYIRDRIADWRRAGDIVSRAGDTIAATLDDSRVLVLADLPGLLGPPDDVYWPAYLFRGAFNQDSLIRLKRPDVIPPRLRLVTTRRLDDVVVATEVVTPEELRRLAAEPQTAVLQFNPRTERLERIAGGVD